MAIPDEQLTRMEQYLNRTATGGGTIPEVPLTRVEQYLAKIAGEDVTVPDVPYTRIEQYLAYIAENGGGGDSGVEHYRYTHAEDWLTDALGNTFNFYQTYLKSVYANKTSGFGFAVVSNNSTSSQYAAMFTFRNFAISNKTAWIRNNTPANIMVDSGSESGSFYLTAGSIVDVYIIEEAI
jgi:hypothetical protein